MRTYTQEEKQAVIDRVISGEPSAHILADTGIPKSTFYNWLRIYQEEQNAANRRTVDIRNFHLLENKVARLESIVEILKSAPCTLRLAEGSRRLLIQKDIASAKSEAMSLAGAEGFEVAAQPLLRCPKKSSVAYRQSPSPFSTAALRYARFFCHRQRSRPHPARST